MARAKRHYFQAMFGITLQGYWKQVSIIVDRMTINMTGDTVGSFPSSYAGDVGVVPIPTAAWLLGSGLIGLLVIRKKLQR